MEGGPPSAGSPGDTTASGGCTLQARRHHQVFTVHAHAYRLLVVLSAEEGSSWGGKSQRRVVHLKGRTRTFRRG
jgi:hypothetical protein